MKKIMTFALCVCAVGSMSAQKQAVEEANKLAGKLDKIEDARNLIKQAMQNPETKDNVHTYNVAGKIEYKAFEEAAKKRAVNPEDPAADVVAMGRELINGYNFYNKALPLDSIPNEKGQVKPKYSKEMVAQINGHHADYYNYAGELYNAKQYFPDAYNAFMIYGDLPSMPYATKEIKATPDTIRALAYYYAGIAAYSGADLQKALEAFHKARRAGISDPQSYVYEIACWQNMASKDSTLTDKAQANIYDVALEGFNRFGIANPLFLNNLVNSLTIQEKFDDAIALINKQLSVKEEPFLLSLRGFVNDRKGDNEASEADYRKAAGFENADIETLKNAAKKLYTIGSAKWNEIEGPNKEARDNIKQNYWQEAKNIAERAKALDPSDSQIDYVLENINYALETYF
ncbi:MAG: hypothetical protein NC204_03655 [Candidatus Amulumruptor caecigallinarius]|nr:hypothetical protein [Candidatus Amulumruptor caecigallinarius]